MVRKTNLILNIRSGHITSPRESFGPREKHGSMKINMVQ